MNTNSPNIEQSQPEKSTGKMDKWFEGMLNSIKVDQLQLQTNTADAEKERMYHNMIEGRHLEMFSDMRNLSSQFFIEELVKDYIKELKLRKVKSNKLAFDLGDAKVLVWAEINDFDENSENGLILSEAKTNATFSKYGFHISSTIVEASDKVAVPSHYATFNAK